VRLDTNRGNGYPLPNLTSDPRNAASGIFPNFDCKNLDYSPISQNPDEDELPAGQSRPGINQGQPPDETFAPCIIQRDFPDAFGGERGPQLFADP
jgi:hypothetical protein